MGKRWLVSAAMIVLAIVIVVTVEGVLGALIGSLFIIGMLFLWTVPGGVFGRQSAGEQDPLARKVTQALLGIGLGLIAASIAAFVLPPQMFSWLLIAVGLAIVAWIFLRR